ncbi:MAG: FAD-binding protein [Pseudomonadales bacterium]|nr:FAD-binding protein [Pseudomonadales bacterium]
MTLSVTANWGCVRARKPDDDKAELKSRADDLARRKTRKIAKGKDMQWNNWSGRHRVELDSLRFVRREEDAAAFVAEYAATGKTIRVAGSGHSHAPVVVNEEAILDVSGLSGLVSVDQDTKTAWMRAGSTIYSLGIQLHEHGLALRNQGDIDRQQVGGVIATGTHGTGRNLKNISGSVKGVKLILADGSFVNCSAEENADLFQVARLSVGSVGVITQVEMVLNPSRVLQESGVPMSYDEVAPRIPELIENNERWEFFWFPRNDQTVTKSINPSDEPPSYPLAEEGGRRAFSFEVLPNHRSVPHTEMEYSIPAESGPECFARIRELIHSKFPEVQWPVEYRTIAEDDIWLSMAFGRPTVSISVHQDVRLDEEPYYRACEEIFLSYGGRPHWGKVHYLSADQFAAIYPHWGDWWRVRDQYDQNGVFLNEHFRSLRPA